MSVPKFERGDIVDVAMSTDIDGKPILILSVLDAITVHECLCNDENIREDHPTLLKVHKFIEEYAAGGQVPRQGS